MGTSIGEIRSDTHNVVYFWDRGNTEDKTHTKWNKPYPSDKILKPLDQGTYIDIKIQTELQQKPKPRIQHKNHDEKKKRMKQTLSKSKTQVKLHVCPKGYVCIHILRYSSCR